MSDFDAFVEGLLDETRDEINRADTKANILLAGAGVALAALGGAFLSKNVTLENAPGAVQVLADAAGAFMLIGVVLLGLAVVPRLGKATEGRARYFMDHAQYDDLREFRKALEQEATHPAGRHIHQLRDLSKIVRWKFRFTQAGQTMIGAGLALALASAFAKHIIGR